MDSLLSENTKVDCSSFRGGSASEDASSYVCFNPEKRAGSLVVAGAKAVKQSIGSQVACRLALEHFSEAVFEYYDTISPSEGDEEKEESLRALESAFRTANRSVYSFGHSLAAGGRMAAAFIALVLKDSFVASGRVAGGSVYLFRDSELFPFFEPTLKEHAQEEYLGAQSMVSVELASVPLSGDDQVFIFSELLTDEQERILARLASEEQRWEGVENPAERVSRLLFSSPDAVDFTLWFRFGPKSIYLGKDAIA